MGRRAGDALLEPSARIPVLADMCLGRAVTRFAGDADFSDTGVGEKTSRWWSHARFTADVVTVNALVIPCAEVRQLALVGWLQEHVVAMDPAAFADVVSPGELPEFSGSLAGEPEDLEMV